MTKGDSSIEGTSSTSSNSTEVNTNDNTQAVIDDTNAALDDLADDVASNDDND